MKELNQPELPELTLSAEDSPAKTCQLQESKQELQQVAPVYGESSPELLAKYVPDTSSWRTYQRCLLATAEHGCAEFLATLPKSGMMRNGTLYRLETLKDYQPVRHTDVTESGLWPTPTTQEIHHKDAELTPTGRRKSKTSDSSHSLNLADKVTMWATPNASDNRDRGNLSSPCVKRRKRIGKQIVLSQSVSEVSGQLNPAWVCWLMGLPLDYLDLDGYQNPELEGLPPEYLIGSTNSRRSETD
jgi:DNA (cytosine-5)-methyltransferase 1